MFQIIKTLLIVAGSVIILVVLVFFFLVYCVSSALSNPSYKDSIGIAERLLGCSLGKEYEFIEYKAQYNHPDRPLHFVVKIPYKKFAKVVEYCDREANKHKKDTTTVDGDDYITESPISFVNYCWKRGGPTYGYMKSRRVEFGEPAGLLLFSQSVFVDVVNRQIEYDHTGY